MLRKQRDLSVIRVADQTALWSLLPLEDVGQHGARCGQLTHLAQELGLGILTHQTGGNRHGTMGNLKKEEDKVKVELEHDQDTSTS